MGPLSIVCNCIVYTLDCSLRGLSWANLTMCQPSICASTRWALNDGLFDLLERETSHHGALYNLLDEVPNLHSPHYTRVQRNPRVGYVFYGNRQCLEFCSPLYIHLKF